MFNVVSFSKKFSEVKKINFHEFEDYRGKFKKIYKNEIFSDFLQNIDEIYFSDSQKNVFRGIHLQKSPFEIEKVVTCIKGKVTGVFIDLRKNSNTYCEFQTYQLSENENQAIYIPKGFGHGYKAELENSIVLYAQCGIYSVQHEIGVNVLSLGIKEFSKNIILSEKDKKLPTLEIYKSEQL